jgi:small-conductance mechanosensitive channel
MNAITNLYQNILQIDFWGNTGREYLIALGVFAGALIVLKITQMLILGRLKKLAEKTKTDLDDILIETISSIRPPFYFFISLYLAVKSLTFPLLANKIIDGVFILVIVYEITKAIQIFIGYGTQKIIDKSTNKDTANKDVLKNIGLVAKIIIWIFAILIVLSNWGVNITSLVAGLGIGGVAIAFALQNILEDIFSSFSIFIDKPFKIGDFIIVGDDMGVVEKIGIKTTRIKTLQGQELVISNKELTSARINNYKKMEKRRIVFELGVCYETPTEKLKKIPAMIKEIIEKENNADLDRAHFKSYGDFSLNYEIVYYVSSGDYNQYMDIQQSINLAIKDAFERQEIEFAYPTQTILMGK